MRIVLDTNGFVSAVFFGGPPGAILAAWRDGAVQLVLSAEIADEYRRVGARLSAQFPAVDLGPALHLALSRGVVVTPAPLSQAGCRDPDDDKFIACALSAQAPYLVSGDGDLLAVSRFRGVTILSPRSFVDTVLTRTT